MTILLRPIALKYLNRLNATDKNRIQAAFTELSKEPPMGDIKPLVGNPGYFRLRVGGYRVLFRIENHTLFITNIDPRGQAYKKNRRNK